MNEFLSKRVMPAVLFCTIGTQTVSCFVCIKLHTEIPPAILLMFGMFAIDAISINILAYTLTALINERSTACLQSIKKVTDKYTRKIVRSCCCMKIQFGSNFVDHGTPLVIQDFCWKQTANLILIQSGRHELNQ